MNKETITAKNFYFCFNKNMAKWIRYERGIEFIVKAIHPTSNQTFFMFTRNDELELAIQDYPSFNKSI
ncbi:hypothetical protein [Cohnella sp. WQ 127256]|uniref:hypothetical protein n=1 Tax=Cohnella sp. WQ 127256 TaxID=2938790 RepID=UPI002118017E|nr:hypothetical protein [Cohnella sp. WQ 127256]